MKLTGDHLYQHPRELVFRALLDPEVLSRTLPGCEELEQVDDNQFAGKLKMKVGPVQGVFQGKVELLDIDPPNGYRLQIDGSGAPGFMNGSGTLRLEDADGATKLSYDIDAKVGGKIASIGQRLVESSAKVITRQGLAGLEVQLDRLAEEAGSGVDARATVVAEPSVVAGPSAVAEPSPPTDNATPKTQGSTAPANAGPSQAEFASDFAKGLVEELVPKGSRWVLIAAPLLLAIIAVAVFLRGCT